MKTLFWLTLLFLLGTSLMAQQEEKMMVNRPLNNASINILGDGSIISLNYEKLFLTSSTPILSSKIGLGYNERYQLCLFGPCHFEPAKYLTIPHHVTVNVGEIRHFLELGLGGTIVLGQTTQPYIVYPIIGYRYLPLKAKNVNLRVFGQVPFTGLDTDDILFIPFGLNVGLSF